MNEWASPCLPLDEGAGQNPSRALRVLPDGLRPNLTEPARLWAWLYALTARNAILNVVRRWLNGLSLWQWAVLNSCSGFVAVASAAAIIWLTGHHIDIRWFAEYGAFYAVFYGGFSTLARYLRMRRRQERWPQTSPDHQF